MIKFLQIFFFITLFTTISSAQLELPIVRVDYPEYVVANASFEVSAVFRFNEKPMQSFRLNFAKSDLVNISAASIFFEGKRHPLSIYSPINPQDFSVKINVDNFNIEDNLPYQIIFVCKVTNAVNTAEELIVYTGFTKIKKFQIRI